MKKKSQRASDDNGQTLISSTGAQITKDNDNHDEETLKKDTTRMFLYNFMMKAVFEKKSTFIAIARVPNIKLLPSEYDITERYTDPNMSIQQAYRAMNPRATIKLAHVDLKGDTVAHIFSITKSVMGLLWAYLVFNPTNDPFIQKLNLKKHLLDTNSKESRLSYYLSDVRPTFMSLPKVLDRPMKDFFTQTSQVVTDEYDFAQVMTTLVITDEKSESKFESFNSLFGDNYVSVVPYPSFKYDNLLTQVASLALEDHMKMVTENPEYLVKTEVIKLLFPPRFATLPHIKKWPLLDAGYEIAGYNGTVKNTMTLAGIRMTGNEMMELGLYWLEHHHSLLLNIRTNPDFQVTLTTDLSHREHDIRGGWIYSFFFWIPTFMDDSTHLWISCIGHMGQYILMELNTRTVFIRQHFADLPMFQNIDVKNLKSDDCKYEDFAVDVHVLLKDLEKISSYEFKE
jgi:hypothetical protein